MVSSELSQSDYTALAEFRYRIRRFLKFSEQAAKAAGVTPRQHQAMLTIKGYGRGEGVLVGDLAEQLTIRHHSAVELSGRLCANGLATKERDPNDRRRTYLRLTERAEELLAQLSAAHLEEISRIESTLTRLLAAIERHKEAASPEREAQDRGTPQ